jgi:hypothetical protein
VNAALNKQGQLMIVVVGFFATVLLLAMRAGDGMTPVSRAVVTLAVAVGCAVRYWWVILLLPWPARWFRMVALLLAWSALPIVAVMSPNVVRWALALAALLAVGSITEAYNWHTRQWMVGCEEASRSLEVDHLTGAAAAAGGTALLLLVVFYRPQWLEFVIPLMVVADWVRLVVMIRRHQRFIDLGYLT